MSTTAELNDAFRKSLSNVTVDDLPADGDILINFGDNVVDISEILDELRQKEIVDVLHAVAIYDEFTIGDATDEHRSSGPIAHAGACYQFSIEYVDAGLKVHSFDTGDNWRYMTIEPVYEE